MTSNNSIDKKFWEEVYVQKTGDYIKKKDSFWSRDYTHTKRTFKKLISFNKKYS